MYKYIVTKDGIQKVKLSQEEIDDQGGGADVDEPTYVKPVEEEIKDLKAENKRTKVILDNAIERNNMIEDTLLELIITVLK